MAVTLECDCCGSGIVRTNYKAARAKRHFCSNECRQKGQRKDVIATRYRMVNVGTDHPLAGASGVIPEHRKLLFEAIGPGEHPCRWCAIPVEWRQGGRTSVGSLVVDHVDGDPKNNDLANLVPCCHRCNAKRRTDRVRDGETHVVAKATGNRTRAVIRTCRTCGGEFAVSPAAIASKKNGGTYCSRTCLHRRPPR